MVSEKQTEIRSESPTVEAPLPNNKVLRNLRRLPLEKQEEAFWAWRDKTDPEWIMTANVRAAEVAVDNGDTDEELRLVTLADFEKIGADKYAERLSTGRLTEEELATRNAMHILFPQSMTSESA